MISFDWIAANGTPVDLVIFLLGMMVVSYIIFIQKRLIDELRHEASELRKKYHQVDKLTYGIAIAIQRKTGIKLQNQSADGKGENALHRDVE